MRATAELADRLTELLMLAYPPVAVTFCKSTPSGGIEAVAMQPAGCCYWTPAQKGRLTTKPSDHSNCSVGSYTHGLIDLEVPTIPRPCWGVGGSEGPISRTLLGRAAKAGT